MVRITLALTATCTFLLAATGGPLVVRLASARELAIGEDCRAETPCNVRVGNIVHMFTQQAFVKITAGSGTARIYVAPSGMLTVGHAGLTLQCDRCAIAAGITNFPPDAVPLWTWTASSGKWDSTGLDHRALLGIEHITGGEGMVVTQSGAETRVSTNPSVVPVRVGVPKSVRDPCTEGAWAADASHFYLCVAPDTWRRATLQPW